MAINYVVTKRIFGFDKTKKVRYVAKSVLTDEISFDETCRKVSQICGIHRGTVKVVLDGMIDTMINDVQHGHPVRLGEFGSIRPSLKCKSADKEESVTANNVYRTKLVFVPGRELKNMLKHVSIQKFMEPDVDYTVPVDDGDEAVDPLA